MSARRPVVAVALVALAALSMSSSCTVPSEPSTAPGSPGVRTEATAPLTPTTEATADVGQPAPGQATPTGPTPGQTEGPYFKAGSPERESLLEARNTGDRLELTGMVVEESGRPIPRARIEFWQADENGAYDNAGYGFRGHQFTDANGSYWLETVVPGAYSGRTRHIHVKVIAPDGRQLTTQLYFPDDPGNQRDRIFDPRLVLSRVTRAGEVTSATFDFVLAGD
jgi:protocatechuate 3,4-dioxygenase beta subunit